MKTVTIASQLNCKALRADFPKMRDEAFEAALKIASYVSNAMSSNERNIKQFYISFVALRKILPNPVIRNIVVVGPHLMDFISLIQESSGLGVVMVNDGLWFFDMVSRTPVRGTFHASKVAEVYKAITAESLIIQFIGDEEIESEE